MAITPQESHQIQILFHQFIVLIFKNIVLESFHILISKWIQTTLMKIWYIYDLSRQELDQIEKNLINKLQYYHKTLFKWIVFLAYQLYLVEFDF